MDSQGSAAAGFDPRLRIWLLAVIVMILAGWALHMMAAVFVPIVCSVFVALLVFPVDRWVAEHVPGRMSWLGHVAAFGVVLFVIGLFVGSFWLAGERIEERFPHVDEVIQSQAAQIASEASEDDDGGADAPQIAVGQGGDGAGASDRTPFEQALDDVRSLLGEYGLQVARAAVESVGAVLAGLILILFLTLLLLVEQDRWLSKLDALKGSETGRWLQPIGTVAAKIRRYLLARTILGILTAALYSFWLWIFGIDLLMVWALLTVVLNFIPNIGSMISGGLPMMYALLTRDLQSALLVGAGLLVIEQVVGNYIDPVVQGRQVSLSPYLVLVLVLVWGWIWGVAGAVLATPITVTALVFFAHIPALRPLALLLSRERDMKGLAEATGAN